jgi:hypothetical protein
LLSILASSREIVAGKTYLRNTYRKELVYLKEEYNIANTNLFVKQADSIAARGSCIFLGILLRDYLGPCHAVKIEIKNV